MSAQANGPRPKPGILAIAPYVGGRSTAAGANEAVKLSANESALSTSPKAIAAYQAQSGQLHRYPDGGSVDLRAAIGRRFGLDPEKIICGEGSDEIIHLACLAYAGPGDEVLSSEHGFLVYPIAARSVGATPVMAPERNLRSDVDALLGAVTPRTRIVFIANPNNPTGSYLTGDELKRLHAGLPETVLLVIDAAYAEFVDATDYAAGIELAGAATNVLMTRTFSKIYGLAALRLGWAYGSAPLIDVLNRIRGPFNISGPAQAAGVAALEDTDFINKAREHNAVWRLWLERRLLELGLEVAPSVANFLLIRFGDPETARAADEFLSARGYLLRAMDAYGLSDCLRLTVGRENENRGVIDGLEHFQSLPGQKESF
ncbi:MAG: histidinol-phosphate transaminase [Sphingomonadales bacterium]